MSTQHPEPARAAAKSLRTFHILQRGSTVRLTYQGGRTGTKWVYSPRITRISAGELEIEMFVPLAVGAPVELRDDLPHRGPAATVILPPLPAHVTACRCRANGLFRIELSPGAAPS
jgi:hypothetical protein